MNKFLKENWFRATILLILVVIVVIFGNYLSGKDKFERERQTKLDQQKYEEGRRAECLKIFQVEDEKWGNVRNHEYVPEDDTCYISYKAQQGEWDGVNCDEIGKDWNYEVFGIDNSLTRSMWRRQMNCQNNQFENEF